MKQKLFITFLTLALTLSLTLSPTYAFSTEKVLTPTTIEPLIIESRSNITVYKYQTFDGRRWKRLWSLTYNRWEEPYWTLA